MYIFGIEMSSDGDDRTGSGQSSGNWSAPVDNPIQTDPRLGGSMNQETVWKLPGNVDPKFIAPYYNNSKNPNRRVLDPSMGPNQYKDLDFSLPNENNEYPIMITLGNGEVSRPALRMATSVPYNQDYEAQVGITTAKQQFIAMVAAWPLSTTSLGNPRFLVPYVKFFIDAIVPDSLTQFWDIPVQLFLYIVGDEVSIGLNMNGDYLSSFGVYNDLLEKSSNAVECIKAVLLAVGETKLYASAIHGVCINAFQKSASEFVNPVTNSGMSYLDVISIGLGILNKARKGVITVSSPTWSNDIQYVNMIYNSVAAGLANVRDANMRVVFDKMKSFLEPIVHPEIIKDLQTRTNINAIAISDHTNVLRDHAYRLNKHEGRIFSLETANSALRDFGDQGLNKPPQDKHLVKIRDEILNIFREVATPNSNWSDAKIVQNVIDTAVSRVIGQRPPQIATPIKDEAMKGGNVPIATGIANMQSAIPQEVKTVSVIQSILNHPWWIQTMRDIHNTYNAEKANADAKGMKLEIDFVKFVNDIVKTNMARIPQTDAGGIALKDALIRNSQILGQHAVDFLRSTITIETTQISLLNETGQKLLEAFKAKVELEKTNISVITTEEDSKNREELKNQTETLNSLKKQIDDQKKQFSELLANIDRAKFTLDAKQKRMKEFTESKDTVSTLKSLINGFLALNDMSIDATSIKGFVERQIAEWAKAWSDSSRPEIALAKRIVNGDLNKESSEIYEFFANMIADIATKLKSISNLNRDVGKEFLEKTLNTVIGEDAESVKTKYETGVRDELSKNLQSVANTYKTQLISLLATSTKEVIDAKNKATEEMLTKNIRELGTKYKQEVEGLSGKVTASKETIERVEKDANEILKKLSQATGIVDDHKNYMENLDEFEKRIKVSLGIMTDAIKRDEDAFLEKLRTLETAKSDVFKKMEETKGAVTDATAALTATTGKTLRDLVVANRIMRITQAEIAEIADELQKGSVSTTSETKQSIFSRFAGAVSSVFSRGSTPITNDVVTQAAITAIKRFLPNMIDTDDELNQDHVRYVSSRIQAELNTRKIIEKHTDDLKKEYALNVNAMTARLSLFNTGVFDKDTLKAAEQIIDDVKRGKDSDKQSGETALSLGILQLQLRTYAGLKKDIDDIKRIGNAKPSDIVEMNTKNEEIVRTQAEISKQLGILQGQLTQESLQNAVQPVLESYSKQLEELRNTQVNDIVGLKALLEQIQKSKVTSDKAAVETLQQHAHMIEDTISRKMASVSMSNQSANEEVAKEVNALKRNVDEFLKEAAKKESDREARIAELEKAKSEDLEKRKAYETQLAELKAASAKAHSEYAKGIANAISTLQGIVTQVTEKIPSDLETAWKSHLVDINGKIKAVEDKFVKAQLDGKKLAADEFKDLLNEFLASAKTTIEIDVEKELAKKKKEVLNVHSDAERAKVLLDDLMARNQEASKNAADAKKAADDAAAAVVSVQRELGIALQALSKATESGKKELEAKANELRGKLDEAKKKEDEAKRKVDDEKKKGEKRKEEAAELEKELAKKKDDEERLKKEEARLNDLKEKLVRDAKGEFARLKKEALDGITGLVEKASDELDEAAESVNEASIDTERIDGEINDIYDRIKKLVKNVDDTNGMLLALLKKSKAKFETVDKSIDDVNKRLDALEKIRSAISMPAKDKSQEFDPAKLGDVVSNVMTTRPEIWQEPVKEFVLDLTGKLETRVGAVEKEVKEVKEDVEEIKEKVEELERKKEEGEAEKEKEKKAKEEKEKIPMILNQYFYNVYKGKTVPTEKQRESLPEKEKIVPTEKQSMPMETGSEEVIAPTEKPREKTPKGETELITPAASVVGVIPKGSPPAVPARPFHIYDKYRYETLVNKMRSNFENGKGDPFYLTHVTAEADSSIFPVYSPDVSENKKNLEELKSQVEKKWDGFVAEFKDRFAKKETFILGSRCGAGAGKVTADTLRNTLNGMPNLKTVIIPFDNDPANPGDVISDAMLCSVLWDNKLADWKSRITMLVAKLPRIARAANYLRTTASYLDRYPNLREVVLYFDSDVFSENYPRKNPKTPISLSMNIVFGERNTFDESEGGVRNVSSGGMLRNGDDVYSWPMWTKDSDNQISYDVAYMKVSILSQGIIKINGNDLKEKL